MLFIFRKEFIKFSAILLLLFSNSAYSQYYWGAVYVDKNTRIAGGSYNMSSESEAKKVALDSCVKKHNGKSNNCVFAQSFYNGCVSIYIGNNAKGGWGVNGIDTYNAKFQAAQACQESGGIECREVLSFCTTRYY
ncbi:DUF4189 domain-containing protein [Pseudomonas sp. F1_0610]|uniref:DUF4189 domain-containing protein n=1 Tax=Pseudomonas sp. F1_0610 TaxID=3114284 RepID=UPI0039C297B4